MKVKSDTRYLPRHKWYLHEAQGLISQLQAQLWPLNYHVTLGGSVLNHGYSDTDLDLFVLPIYKPGQPHDIAALDAALDSVLGERVVDFSQTPGPSVDPAWVNTGDTAFERAVRYRYRQHKVIDVFVVRP